MFKIQIPKPCSADWKEMMPTQQGAFCGSCSKEVVDFTQMNDEEVKHYFLQRSTGNTCGRFRTEQIHRIRISLPDNIFLKKMAGWKKFMAVVMLAFGSMLFGCDVGVQDKTVGTIANPKIENGQTKGDATVADTTRTMGAPMPEMGKPVLIKKDAPCNTLTGAVAPPVEYPVLLGEPAMVPDSVVKPPVTDTANYSKMGKMAIPGVQKKKPASDTGKCKDSGYY